MFKAKLKKDDRVDKLMGKSKKKAVNLLLDEELVAQFKSKTAKDRISMTRILVDAIYAYLKKS